MTFFRRIGAWLSRGVLGRKPECAERSGDFVYVKIPESLMPLDRGSKYEDPIDAALRALDLGEVSGGGSQLGDLAADGTRSIVFCGLDVEAKDLGRVRVLLRRSLVELGAPPGTELHFTIGERKLQDELGAGGWSLARPRTFVHPYFEV